MFWLVNYFIQHICCIDAWIIHQLHVATIISRYFYLPGSMCSTKQFKVLPTRSLWLGGREERKTTARRENTKTYISHAPGGKRTPGKLNMECFCLWLLTKSNSTKELKDCMILMKRRPPSVRGCYQRGEGLRNETSSAIGCKNLAVNIYLFKLLISWYYQCAVFRDEKHGAWAIEKKIKKINLRCQPRSFYVKAHNSMKLTPTQLTDILITVAVPLNTPLGNQSLI